MPVIQAREISEDAAVAAVIEAPTPAGSATTSVGNIDVARSPIRQTAPADWARNAPKSLPFARPRYIDTMRAIAKSKANTQATGHIAGSIAGRMTPSVIAPQTTNSTSVTTCRTPPSLRARARRSLPSGVLSAIHKHPAVRHIAKPRSPTSSVYGVMSPRSGTPE